MSEGDGRGDMGTGDTGGGTWVRGLGQGGHGRWDMDRGAWGHLTYKSRLCRTTTSCLLSRDFAQ